MDPYSFYYDQEYAGYYRSIERFLDTYLNLKNKDVLCLASGTGHIQMHYVDNGAKSVTCVDISRNFLDVFRGKIAGRPEYSEKISLVRGDMAKFRFGKKFDIVFLLGNSFSHLMTQELQVSCLERIRQHLKQDGRAYLHIMPLSDKMNGDFRLKRSFADRNGRSVVETARGRLSYPGHKLDFEVQWRSGAGVIKETLHTRLITVPEMELLLKLTGLKVENIYFDYGKKKKKGAAVWIYEVKK
ncbi:MAG: hypothetical protein FD189_475 [Elusimicrobia bacterium]|nr:MAG: hypothetical protein FD154_1768 [Elusimicrobiota bacterium]KAF0157461.1 MAG: hypothetical protein FD189_475 [Elusimicrobiota bacterium]